MTAETSPYALRTADNIARNDVLKLRSSLRESLRVAIVELPVELDADVR